MAQLFLPFRQTVRTAPGALATEARLLEELAALRDAARDSPRLLARPVRVVVPSRSLRLHLSRVVTEQLGTVLGLQVQTLHSVAREIVERAAASLPDAGALEQVVVLRLARRHPALAEVLERFEEVDGTLAGAVAQLVDAGARPEHLGALLDCLAEAELSPDERNRAVALVRVACGVEPVLRSLGLLNAPQLLRRATELLRAEGHAALPCRAVLVHGFAEATETAQDLIEQLLRLDSATCLVDLPPDPATPQQRDDGVRFALRLHERLAHARPRDPDGFPPPPALAAFEAAGMDAECREVARRVHHLLRGGALPEQVSIVARDIEPYATPLRRHLDRVGIPYSGAGSKGPTTPMVRWTRVDELLDPSGRIRPEQWLDLLGALEPGEALGPGLRTDLRLACSALGLVRVEQLAELPVEELLGGRDHLPLPARGGLGQGQDEWSARRRELPRTALWAAVAAARRLVKWRRECPQRARTADWLVHLDRLMADVLLRDLALVRTDWPDLELELEEVRLLLRHATRDFGATELGGRGGGVAVLSVTEARGRTAEHLFVVGLNRGAFPRVVRDDPLLPDATRRALGEVLPGLSLKSGGAWEERYLFAQLLSSAPHVTLSWLVADDDGKPASPSPLVERLRWTSEWTEPAQVGGPGPLTALEHAIAAGLAGRRDHLARLLSYLPDTTPALAQAHAGIVDELDPDLATQDGRARLSRLGPYLGQVGGDLPGTDGALFITQVEKLARCPWQAFVSGVLRAGPLPDPLQAVPQADARLTGTLLHAVLERIVTAVTRNRELAGAEPASVSWPQEGDLGRLCLQQARMLLQQEGLALPGLDRVLARRVRPMLQVVRDLDWAGEPPAVLGAELLATARLGGRQIHFKIDRADVRGDRVVLTDYKSSRPPELPKRATAREDKLRTWVSQGQRLQAAAYAASTDRAEGRFLFTGGSAELEERQLVVRHGELERELHQTVSAVTDLLSHGVLFPRLVTPDGDREPSACEFCDVAEACLRGDSTSRGRVERWAEARKTERAMGGELPAWQEAVLAVWDMGGAS